MIAGPIRVDSIKWNDRTMDLRGTMYYLAEPLTFTIAYDHVAASALVKDDGTHLLIAVGHHLFTMVFQSDTAASDCAAELSRRMAKSP